LSHDTTTTPSTPSNKDRDDPVLRHSHGPVVVVVVPPPPPPPPPPPKAVCAAAGGPEVVTARDADECKLLVPKGAWPVVKLTASIAADHIPERARAALLAAFEEKAKDLVLNPHSDATDGAGDDIYARRAAAVKDKAAAAAGSMVSKARSLAMTWR
jgi:hypothetical protein